MNPQTGLDELIDTVEALKKEMGKEFKEIRELISGLTEDLNTLSGFVGDMYDEMQSGFTSAFTAIGELQEELDAVEEQVIRNTEDIETLSGVVETIAEELAALEVEVENIEGAVGLDEEGNYIPKSGTTYLDEAESVEGEIAILDEVVASAMTEIEELKKKTIEPLDDSIVVEVSGYTTYVGVKLPENGMIRLDEEGLYLDGNFGSDEPDEE